MRPAPEVHDALACLLTYPRQEATGMRYPAAVEVIARACPDTADELRGFSEAVCGFSGGELEELYTRTFDNVAERSLEVGWQLHGENYARGVLMVRFRALMREYDVPEKTELPDHLTHVLALLARLPSKTASAFASNQVIQAVDKVLEGLRSYESPWIGVLEATRKVVQMHQDEPMHTAEAIR